MTLKRGRNIKYSPYVFTENGVAMLSTHEELRRKIDKIEKEYDDQFKVVFEAIQALMTPPEKKKG